MQGIDNIYYGIIWEMIHVHALIVNRIYPQYWDRQAWANSVYQKYSCKFYGKYWQLAASAFIVNFYGGP